MQSVLAARAAGTLMPAGQGEPGYPQAGDTASKVTRAQVDNQVLQARANGELLATGEAAEYGMEPITHPTHAFASSGQNVATSGAK